MHAKILRMFLIDSCNKPLHVVSKVLLRRNNQQMLKITQKVKISPGILLLHFLQHKTDANAFVVAPKLAKEEI